MPPPDPNARARFEWTPDRDQRLRDLAKAGTSVRAIATDIGTSKSVVDRRLKALGIPLDRTMTAAATQANTLDAKARRARLMLRHLTRAEHLFDRLEAPTFTTLTRAGQGAEKESTLDFVPTQNERDLALTIKTHLDSALKLDLHDAVGTDMPAVDAWLAHMTGGRMGAASEPPNGATSEGSSDSPI